VTWVGSVERLGHVVDAPVRVVRLRHHGRQQHGDGDQQEKFGGHCCGSVLSETKKTKTFDKSMFMYTFSFYGKLFDL